MIRFKIFQISQILIIAFFVIFFGCNKTSQQNEEVINVLTAGKGTIDSLILAYSEQIIENPDDDDLYYRRAKLYRAIEKPLLAIADMEKAIEFEPEIYEYQNILGDIFFNVTNIQGAIEAYSRSTELNPNDDYAFLELGKIYLYRAEPEIAITYLNEALKISKYNPETYSNKALYYLQMKDTNKAISFLETAVNVDPDYLNAYIDLGYLYSIQQDNRALLFFENALRIDPQNTQVLYNRGKFKQDMGDFELAVADYQMILAVHPDHKSANYNLGFINYLMGNYEQAIQFFSTAVLKDPNYSVAYYGLGLCYKEMANFEMAKENFNKVLLLEPEDELAQLELNKLR
ncbi:MAG: tetratricopeptide repeat protein [Bacteroidetes bacterium]|nr:tetratricopeptide repeat protein [Bacteroidota bacterium]MBL6962250.1 tetratricopeptide repeat protein [Bacteroidota bacterium]